MLVRPIPVELSQVPETHVESRERPTEVAFYGSYDWSLNPHLTVDEAVDRLGGEIDRLGSVSRDWRLDEVATNVFLLAAGILNRIEEYVRGATLRLPRRLQGFSVGRGAVRAAEAIFNDPWPGDRRGLRDRAQRFQSGLHKFLLPRVSGEPPDQATLSRAADVLAMVAKEPLPEKLRRQRLKPPSPFSRLDLTDCDVLSLGRGFVEACPDRSLPILLVGLRTSGSYFCPLLRAFLDRQGYRTVASLTIEPNKGAGRFERRELKRYAREGRRALIVDDPPHTAGALFLAFDIVRRAGFRKGNVKFVVPTHVARRSWAKDLPSDMIVSLQPDEWHKERLLQPKTVEARLDAYFRDRGARSARVVASARADQLNLRLAEEVAVERGVRLKRVFEVEVTQAQGRSERRLILARSVGFGWYAYRAFLAAQRLETFVPPVLGMRDGILYMDWIDPSDDEHAVGGDMVARMAAYIAARVKGLGLGATSLGAASVKGGDNGVDQLARTLVAAYGQFPAGVLRRGRLAEILRSKLGAQSTFIDGNMRKSEWVAGRAAALKVDYEHHGLGKDVLNHVDAAYDLADAILNFSLSPEEEERLVRDYVSASEDTDVGRRLFVNKLVAGVWEMSQAQKQLASQPLDARMQKDAHERFMASWHFLIREMARHCGGYCRRPRVVEWRAPLVVLDIDGVIDRRVLGFPTTTPAGIAALSLLHSRGFCLALDTARSLQEVKEYCEAYSLAGGVAELGSYMWDAVRGRGEVLVEPDALHQLEQLRRRLREIPGVFLDDRHQCSVRAFSYRNEARGTLAQIMKSIRAAPYGESAVGPLPALLVHHVLKELGLDLVTFHQNAIDTTFVAKRVDKGTGLAALRDWVLGSEAETIAIGDSDQDLPMFHAATRSYAPSNIACGREAQLVGCQVASRPYQRGFLEIARMIAPSVGAAAGSALLTDAMTGGQGDGIVAILGAADRGWLGNFFGSFGDPAGFGAFTR
jgi:hydroxymethylpyrimidine pyrophosphatase-like HAD family hydrolase